MAVVELLMELARVDEDENPVYDGKTDAEIVIALNEWHTTYVPCPTAALLKKFSELALQGRMELAREKGNVDDKHLARWLTLLKFCEQFAIPVMFNAGRPSVADLFEYMSAAGIITPTETTWLLDLGCFRLTIGRTVFQRDVTAVDIAKAREMQPLANKVRTRREAEEAEHVAKLAEVQAAHDELQKRDPNSLEIIGDKNHVPSWERSR